MPQRILVVGGSGAQGVPIVAELARDPNYTVRVLTRDDTSQSSKQLAALPNVALHLGPSHDEDSLRAAFRDVDLAFVNINSFALGIKNEIWWGIRIFEIAIQSGVKHYIWSSLDNFMHDTLYDESLRAGHYYGKAYVEQWMSALPQTPMRWSILTTGPYIETLWEALRPVEKDGVTLFRAPLGDGAVPLVHLDDLGPYVHWIFTHPEQSAGFNLKVAVEHVSWDYLASTFTKVTGKPAKYENVSMEEYFATSFFAPRADVKLGAEVVPEDDQSILTFKQNFSNWWRIYQRSGGNKGLLQREYALLDQIYPDRVKSLEQWMRKVGYDGQPRTVLKVKLQAR